MATKEMNVAHELNAVATYAANTYFLHEYIAATPLEDRIENGLGMALSKWSECDGAKLLRVLAAALEDANFHTESALVLEMEKTL